MTPSDERAYAQARASDALKFYDTMRRYARIMLALTTLTFITSVYGLVRNAWQDTRLDTLEDRLRVVEACKHGGP
jgi:uncharacterized ion transporter superfamily protein YfcC